MKVMLRRHIQVEQSYRVARAQGLFNVDRSEGETFELTAELPLLEDGMPEGDWTIGVIYGPSGSGKSSLAREFYDRGWTEWGTEIWWDSEKAVIDEIAPDNPFDDVTGALASVGLGTVPTWLRPYQVLSNGERFRVELARLLVEREHQRTVIDEFTSVVDRRVAQIGSLAFAKAWRRQGDRQVVLLTPHYDVLGWIQPDWVIRTSLTGKSMRFDDHNIVVREVERPDGPVLTEIRA